MTVQKKMSVRRPSRTVPHRGVVSVADQRAEHDMATKTRTIATFSAGPIPDPRSLGLYGQIDPTFPERILAVMERQALHRQQLERYNLEQTHSQNAQILNLEDKKLQIDREILGRGQNFGLLVVLMAFCLTFVLAYGGHDWVAAVVGGSATVSLVAVFVTGKFLESKKSSADNAKMVDMPHAEESATE
ncbi:MAG: DUF2335 domain-containing protein [Magnetococcales bacterium]|nr:DUF2335 domain-containing protein [Magnetococcales bacterium]